MQKILVNDDDDLNGITGEESLGTSKQTMETFSITQSHWVAWWNTYKKASGADAIANQAKEKCCLIKHQMRIERYASCSDLVAKQPIYNGLTSKCKKYSSHI